MIPAKCKVHKIIIVGLIIKIIRYYITSRNVEHKIFPSRLVFPIALSRLVFTNWRS